MNGLESDIPVILLTGYRDTEKMQKAWENSVFDFLDKPCDTNHLYNVVESAHEYGREYVTMARKRSVRIKKNRVA